MACQERIGRVCLMCGDASSPGVFPTSFALEGFERTVGRVRGLDGEGMPRMGRQRRLCTVLLPHILADSIRMMGLEPVHF